jgi:hypothetical protein
MDLMMQEEVREVAGKRSEQQAERTANQARQLHCGSGSRLSMVIKKGSPSDTHFLNVDLQIYSNADLQALVTALGKKVFVLFTGRVRQTHCAHLELAKITGTADATIRGFCALIEALPKLERNLWNDAKQRDFNIGVQAGTRPASAEFSLETETVKFAGQLNARIVYTIYAPEQPTKVLAKGRTGSRKRPTAPH